MTDKTRTDDAAILRQCLDRIIESGALGRGHVHPKLLSYLADRALRGEVPKEIDISIDVFGKTPDDLGTADAQTRVHIYKLRARLEAFYAGAGKNDAFRLEIPKGTYQLVTAANHVAAEVDRRVDRQRAWPRFAVAALLGLSLLANIAWLVESFGTGERPAARSALWNGLGENGRSVLLVVGDHFFFGEGDSHVRMRDVAINSEAELRASPAYGARPQLVFETLSYLPRSTVFALQALLSDASIPTDVTLKLVSELTPEDLRSYDVVYVGFVRASGILRDYYFTRSNFIAEPPLLVTLTNVGNGERFTRSGPGPQHNRDYGLFARVTGPAGNRIVMMMGIGDVGVSAVVRAMHAGAGRERTDELLGAAGIGATQDFELLVEAEGHSRTDLDFEILGAYALRAADAPALPTLPTATQTATPELGSAGR